MRKVCWERLSVLVFFVGHFMINKMCRPMSLQTQEYNVCMTYILEGCPVIRGLNKLLCSGICINEASQVHRSAQSYQSSLFRLHFSVMVQLICLRYMPNADAVFSISLSNLYCYYSLCLRYIPKHRRSGLKGDCLSLNIRKILDILSEISQQNRTMSFTLPSTDP